MNAKDKKFIGGICGVLFVFWLLGSGGGPSESANPDPEPVNPEPAELASAWENSPGLREWVTEWGRLLGVYQSNLRFSDESLQRMLRDVAAADNPEEVTEAADFWGCSALDYLKQARRAYLDGGWWLDQIPVGVDPVSFEQRFRVNRLQFAENGETLTAKIADVTRQLADVSVECTDIWGAWMDPEQRKEQRKAERQQYFDEFRPAPHDFFGQPSARRRMSYVQGNTARGWGLGGSPEGDRRGLSLVGARRHGAVVRAAKSLRSY